MICENCGKEHNGQYSNRFCSFKCSKSFSTKNDNKKELKEAKCIICGKTIYINKRASTTECKCEKCNNKYERTCKICGKKFIGNKKQTVCSDECSYINSSLKALSSHFGLDLSVKGTPQIINEFYKIKNELNRLYWKENFSFSDICKKYNYKSNPGNLTKLFRQLGLSRRNFSECVINAYLNNNMPNVYSNQYTYKSEWYTTWNNKEVYLRSSYELDFAKELDENKIDYDVECLRIKYFDTQKNKYRCAIPDFYLPESNTIVEIKSNYTYDKQNMKDKFAAYKNLGYKCKLILEHIETTI